MQVTGVVTAKPSDPRVTTAADDVVGWILTTRHPTRR